MTSEFGKLLRQTFVDSATKGISVAGTAHFGPLWGLVDPFVRLATTFFSEPPADRAIAALLSEWEKDSETKANVNRALDQLRDRTMRELADAFAVLDPLDVERRGNREALSRKAVCASLAGIYFRLNILQALGYLRILGLSEGVLTQSQDPQYLSMIRDSLSCQVHPLARFAFEIGLCSVMAAEDVDFARLNLKMAAHWVGLDALVEPYMRDLQPFLDAKDQDGLIDLVRDFAQGLVAFAGSPSAAV